MEIRFVYFPQVKNEVLWYGLQVILNWYQGQFNSNQNVNVLLQQSHKIYLPHHTSKFVSLSILSECHIYIYKIRILSQFYTKGIINRFSLQDFFWCSHLNYYIYNQINKPHSQNDLNNVFSLVIICTLKWLNNYICKF
jgi:hypothetical protein